MAQTFKPGDVVELKSGGRRMTVQWVITEEVHGSNSDVEFGVHVGWHDADGRPQAAIYKPEALKK